MSSATEGLLVTSLSRIHKIKSPVNSGVLAANDGLFGVNILNWIPPASKYFQTLVTPVIVSDHVADALPKRTFHEKTGRRIGRI